LFSYFAALNQYPVFVIRFFVFLSFVFLFPVWTDAYTKERTKIVRKVVVSVERPVKPDVGIYFPATGVAHISHLEIPKTSVGDHIITHAGYSLLYNEHHEQASWVAYELTRGNTVKHFGRSDKFIEDPSIKTGSASSSDYLRSGYDRGHMAPAADMSYSSATMAESFYYSNMSPQVPGFNRGIWKNLEGLIRTWAIEDEEVYVVTGPVLTTGLPTIGFDKVSVPKYYYKVILDYTEPGIKGIGFILPNATSNLPLENFAVSIDSVEAVTGIDFFPLLPKVQQRIIEKTLSVSSWSWNSTNTAARKATKVVKATVDGRGQIFTGPRGGQYYYSKSGRKVYVKRR